MNIETETQAAQAVERVLCFLHGLDVGRQGRPAISQMILDLRDVQYFLVAERDTADKATAQGGVTEGRDCVAGSGSGEAASSTRFAESECAQPPTSGPSS